MYFLLKSTWLMYIWKYPVDFTVNDNLVGKGAELLGHLVFSILNSLIYCRYLLVLQSKNLWPEQVLVFCIWLLFSLLVDCGAFSLSLKSESFTRTNPVTLFLVILLSFVSSFELEMQNILWSRKVYISFKKIFEKIYLSHTRPIYPSPYSRKKNWGER